MHYNYRIIDLYDRSVVANVNLKHIITQLAIVAQNHTKINKPLMLHTDRVSQFTSY